MYCAHLLFKNQISADLTLLHLGKYPQLTLTADRPQQSSDKVTWKIPLDPHYQYSHKKEEDNYPQQNSKTTLGGVFSF